MANRERPPFCTPMSTTTATARLLEHLGLDRERPTLAYLHRIIGEHQRRVPFETLTKLIDYEPGLAHGYFMPPLDLYVQRIVERGAGGLCWTLARGLRELLVELGFDAALMMMQPGHCCVRVELPEGPHYADVGYAAPIFRAYPLFESFVLDSPRERFEYRVEPEGIVITREPGPTKTLDPTPRRLDELNPLLDAANDWSVPHSFLRKLYYAGYDGGLFTTLREGVLTRYLDSGPEKTDIAEADHPAVLADVFGADPALWTEAAAVLRRYMPPAAA